VPSRRQERVPVPRSMKSAPGRSRSAPRPPDHDDHAVGRRRFMTPKIISA
jgi:hypothetical protein